ncbi:CBL-interacting protein kinase 11 [Diplonema papillatum]|nr:CBL-interacting protein kinase 11 [Diplonema papillatum]
MGCTESTEYKSKALERSYAKTPSKQKLVIEHPVKPLFLGSTVLSDSTTSPESLPLTLTSSVGSLSTTLPGMPATVTLGNQTFNVHDFLGQGTYAVVHKVTDQQTGTEYALKSFNKDKMTDSDLNNVARREVDLLKKIAGATEAPQMWHPNVCNMHASGEDHQWLHMVLELAESTDFQDVLKERKLSEDEVKTYFMELMETLDWLHSSRGVCHRDIKPSNLLLSFDGHLMLTDFGLGDSVLSRSGHTEQRELCGTLDFVAPEVGQSAYDGRKADVWSCGVTLFQLLTGKMPWSSSSKTYRRKQISEANYRSSALSKFSPEVQDLVSRLLTADPESRPTACEVRRHPWIARVSSF